MNMQIDAYNIQTGERTDGRTDGRKHRNEQAFRMVVNVPKIKTYKE